MSPDSPGEPRSNIGRQQDERRLSRERTDGTEEALAKGSDTYRLQAGGERQRGCICEPDVLVLSCRRHSLHHGLRAPLDDVGAGRQVLIERQRGIRPAATGDQVIDLRNDQRRREEVLPDRLHPPHDPVRGRRPDGS